MSSPLQNSRNRKCFVDAAMDLILAEGAGGLSVRKVAEKAGFSYATLYHYFENLDHLLWSATVAFLDAVVVKVSPLPDPAAGTFEDLKELFLRYSAYFLEYPSVFDLFFLQQIGPPPPEFVSELSRPRLGVLLEGFLESFADRGLIVRSQVPVLAELISSAVHGQLLMFFSRKTSLSSSEVLVNVRTMLDHLLPDSGPTRGTE